MLCKLSELEEILPSKVRELVPKASALQIAEFLKLAEDTATNRKKERRLAAGLHKK